MADNDHNAANLALVKGWPAVVAIVASGILQLGSNSNPDFGPYMGYASLAALAFLGFFTLKIASKTSANGNQAFDFVRGHMQGLEEFADDLEKRIVQEADKTICSALQQTKREVLARMSALNVAIKELKKTKKSDD